jgi:hypothetical protein
MNERHSIIAFIAVLVAICYLATIAAILAYQGKYAEALGFAGITTGLVGVIGTFRPRAPNQDVTVTNGQASPVPVEVEGERP